jgi:hypothetical protein
MRAIRITCIVVASLLAAAASASAADRYASPTGTSAEPCTQASPCDIVTAVNSAANNDNITIEPGTYNISTTLSDGNNFLTIHGQTGRPRPKIVTNANYGIQLTGGSSLFDVEVDDSAANAWGIAVMFGMEATIRSVYVHTTGADAWACYPDGELLDSVCWQSGPGGGAARPLVVLPASVVAINDTLIASGSGGVGAEVIGAGPANMTISLTNTIVRGAGKDIYVTGEEVSPGKLSITADHSNYANGEDDSTGDGTSMFTPAGTGTNQTSAPKFVNAAAGNFHELSGSPTIGAGKSDVVAGEDDLDGTPWNTSTPDIGAYQFTPTPPPPPSCTGLNASTKFGTSVAIDLQCSNGLLPVTYAIAKAPAHGKLSAIASTGAVTYTPTAGFSGDDSFTYTATSTNGTSTPATVSITVGKSGAKPEPAPVISHAKVHKKTLTFTLNEAASVTVTFARHGHKKRTVKLSGKAGKNSYKLKKLKAGKYTISITASDAGGRANKQTLRLKVKR